MQLTDELAFLKHCLIDPAERYSKADWLYSDFDDNIWNYSFGFKTPKELHWSVPLSNGSNLIDAKNRHILNPLKHYLIASTFSVSGDGDMLRSPEGKSNYFNRAIHIVDYILLNEEIFGLTKFGLAGIGKNDLKALLDRIANNSDSAEAIYDWTHRLQDYSLNLLKTTPKSEIERILFENSDLCTITPDQEESFSFDFDIAILPELRAALFYAGCYRKSTSGYGLALNSVTLSRNIYYRSVRGRFEDKPIQEVFACRPTSGKCFREFPGAPVTNRERETATKSSYVQYRNALYNLGILHEIGASSPSIEDLLEIRNHENLVPPAGRFKTVPSAIIFDSLKDAIEYHLKYGRILLESYCALAKKCLKLGVKPSELDVNIFTKTIGKQAQNLGVTTPSIAASKAMKDASFFADIRSHKGLLESIAVYYGAVQLTVGCLCARRVGELKDLHSQSCLDESETWLVFENRKSTTNLMGLRQTEARPIEPIAVQMLKELIRFQKNLIEIGVLSNYTNIFATPSMTGDLSLNSISSFIYNRNFDYFCDYFQLPTNSLGQRYYIRQHQLRRFFALVFFRSSSFGGIDTLRWMLGHVDLQHTWRYITENVGGAVIRGAKAQAVAESFHEGVADDYNKLAGLIEKRFSTKDFTIIDTDELAFYIESLLEDYKIEIEPIFIKNELGEQIEIAVKILDVPE